MLLAFPTGIFFFVWAVTGMSLSLSLMIMIFGIPFSLLFLGSVRLISLVEGRIVEALLGVRMPRRPIHPGNGKSRPVMERIKEMLIDPRTWGTLFYMVLKLPLGVLDFVFLVVLGSISLSLISSPITDFIGHNFWFEIDGVNYYTIPWLVTPILAVIGLLLLTGLMHIARGMGWMHGNLAKNLLVKAG
jgi:hypothetical protein